MRVQQGRGREREGGREWERYCGGKGMGGREEREGGMEGGHGSGGEGLR